MRLLIPVPMVSQNPRIIDRFRLTEFWHSTGSSLIDRSANQPVPDSLVISFFVVVLDILTDGAPEMRFADRNYPSQALRLDRSYESLGVCVEVWTSAWKPHCTDSSTLERRSKRFREEWISIVNEVAALAKKSVVAVGQIASDLGRPESVGRRDDSSDLNATGLQIDHEEREVSNESSPGYDLDCEEVRRRDRTPMTLQESGPPHRSLSCRVDSILNEDTLDRIPLARVTEIRKGTLNSRVSPSRIIDRHLDDQPLNLARDSRPARRTLR